MFKPFPDAYWAYAIMLRFGCETWVTKYWAR